jgi:hypothetical protein
MKQIRTEFIPFTQNRAPSLLPTMDQVISPSDDLVISAIETTREVCPSMGAVKLLDRIKIRHPQWALSEKRFRKLLHSTSTTNGSGNKGNGIVTEKSLVAITSIDSSLDVASLASKVKVKMFGGEKGKGLVVREKVLQGEVLWQEDPWIITANM